MMLLFVLFNYLFFNLSFAFPSLVVDNSNESQGRMKRDVKYYFLTHTGLPENSDFWMYMAIFAFFYLLIAAIAYTITFIFYRPSEKKEEYPILKQEEVSSIVADKSKASTSSISYDEGSKTPEPSVASALTNSEDRPPSSMMSLSEREHQEEVRKTRSKMKTAKGEFISSRNSLSEMKLVEELKADMKTSKSAVSTKTAKMAPKEKLSGTTSTSTSQETSTSESSSEESEVRPDNSDSWT